MPIIYTPTVGEACREFSQIASETKGLFITPDDRGSDPPHPRATGLARTSASSSSPTDSGSWVSAISAPTAWAFRSGKLALYTACAGIDPAACLPVTLDVGTNNEELRNDVLYLGYPRRRVEGKAYFDLVEEFVTAVQVAISRRADSVRGFPDAHRLRAPQQVPGPRALLQRRHPGHRRGGARRRVFLDADHGRAVQRSADHVPGRRIGVPPGSRIL